MLEDQKTIVGVEYNFENKCSQIVIEDITNKDSNYSPIKIQTDQEYIKTILIDEDNRFMLIGTKNGNVEQLSLNFKKDLGKVIKDYGKLQIGEIYSSFMIEDFAIFGGENSSLGFIDTKKSQYLGQRGGLVMGCIYSIELCWVKQDITELNALLTLSGDEYDYSSSKTDVLDITHLISEKLRNKMDKQNYLQNNNLQKQIKMLKNKLKTAQNKIQEFTNKNKIMEQKIEHLQNQNTQIKKKLSKKIKKLNKKINIHNMVNIKAPVMIVKYFKNKLEQLSNKNK